MNGLTLMNAMNLVYGHMLVNAANPFTKAGGVVTWVSNGIKSVAVPLCILGFVMCGAMFMISDRLGEKAKPRLWAIAGGMIIIGCAGLLANGLKGVAY